MNEGRVKNEKVKRMSWGRGRGGTRRSFKFVKSDDGKEKKKEEELNF